MKNFIIVIVLLLNLQIHTQEVWSAEDNHQTTLSPYETKVSELLKSLKEMTGVPAFSFAVVHKGKLVASVAVGQVDIEKGEAATSQHQFRLASVSKIIGATMLADLVSSGKLDPDAALGSFYPELNKKYHQITVRQLLAHTSGMPHYQVKDYDIYNKHYTSAMDAVKTLKGRSLLSRPGAQYHYSSHGYTLAGAVYEKITGQSLTISLPAYIKELTGRKTPIIEDITKPNSFRSKLYARSGKVMKVEDFEEKSYSVFGAGLSATAPDLAFFGSRVLEKSRQSKDYQDLLFTPIKTTSGEKTGNYLSQVGFGWRIGDDGLGRKVYHHSGSTPGARSTTVLYPDEDLSLTFLSNASWVSSIERIVFALADLYITNAELEILPQTTTLSGAFGKEPFKGNIICQAETCILNDENSALSKWLLRFNKTERKIKGWPVYTYVSDIGKRILMVTKIGFIHLPALRENQKYATTVGRDNVLNIQLHNP